MGEKIIPWECRGGGIFYAGSRRFIRIRANKGSFLPGLEVSGKKGKPKQGKTSQDMVGVNGASLHWWRSQFSIDVTTIRKEQGGGGRALVAVPKSANFPIGKRKGKGRENWPMIWSIRCGKKLRPNKGFLRR